MYVRCNGIWEVGGALSNALYAKGIDYGTVSEESGKISCLPLSIEVRSHLDAQIVMPGMLSLPQTWWITWTSAEAKSGRPGTTYTIEDRFFT